jgi:hypothetical protein
MRDPPSLNESISSVDWFVVDLLVERSGVIFHAMLSNIEGQLHVRNVKAYRSDVVEGITLDDVSKEAHWRRTNLIYDGPCLWHLEMDVVQELFEIVMDHGVYPETLDWMGDWVAYAEHIQYVKWMLGMMEVAIDKDSLGPQEDFLSDKELEELATPVTEWLPSREA